MLLLYDKHAASGYLKTNIAIISSASAAAGFTVMVIFQEKKVALFFFMTKSVRPDKRSLVFQPVNYITPVPKSKNTEVRDINREKKFYVVLI